MCEKNQKENTKAAEEAIEIDDDELENVTGGTIHNVRFTKTTDISQDTKDKI